MTRSFKNIFKLIFHLISVPQEFLWSEWGAPDIPCGLGKQKRTTMCGALRRRLPLIEDSGEPPVYWPSCLTDKFNEVEERLSESSGTLEDCMFNCKDDCRLAWPHLWTIVMQIYTVKLRAEACVTIQEIRNFAF